MIMHFLNKRKAYKYLLLSLWAILLFGCDNSGVFEQNINFDKKQWLKDSSKVFRFDIRDAEKAYNIYWNVRNTISFPYQNLYITYYLEDTLGHRIATDLNNMQLFAPKTGKPYGDGSGDLFSHQFLALPNYHFDSAGMYQLRLQQYMRIDTLKDVVSIGVRVEEAQGE